MFASLVKRFDLLRNRLDRISRRYLDGEPVDALLVEPAVQIAISAINDLTLSAEIHHFCRNREGLFTASGEQYQLVALVQVVAVAHHIRDEDRLPLLQFTPVGYRIALVGNKLHVTDLAEGQRIERFEIERVIRLVFRMQSARCGFDFQDSRRGDHLYAWHALQLAPKRFAHR